MPAQHPAPAVAEPRAVASFDSFEEARAAEEYLVTHGFPAGDATIVGTDVHLVERRLDLAWWRSVITVGVLTGVVWGAGLALVLWLLIPGISLVRVIVTGLLCGLVYGCVTSLVNQGMSHGEHDPAWSMQPVARAYAVQVRAAAAERAEALLEQRTVETPADRPPADTKAEKESPAGQPSTHLRPGVDTRSSTAAPDTPIAAGPARRSGGDADFEVSELETTAARRYRLDL